MTAQHQQPPLGATTLSNTGNEKGIESEDLPSSSSTETIKPAAPIPVAPPKSSSVAAFEAEIAGNAASNGSAAGRLIFSEPDFGPSSNTKSEHSLEAEAYMESEGMMSPMERDISP